jgi:predicted PP-loop superfamily ATPase
VPSNLLLVLNLSLNYVAAVPRSGTAAVDVAFESVSSIAQTKRIKKLSSLSQLEPTASKPAVATANTVAVAMSGGVDSSTVAAILHDRAQTIVGLTMQLWNQRRLPKL